MMSAASSALSTTSCTRRDPHAVASQDLVNRAFDPTEPDRVWMMDVTEHPTGDGKA